MNETEMPWQAWETEAWLNEDGNALPADFAWPHRDKHPDGSMNLQIVIPSYRLTKGYGFWLKTTPYFPGLFEKIHQILARRPELPADGAELAQILNANEPLPGDQTSLF